MKKKTNLKDVTFLIPVRIDSNERIENLGLVLEFLKSNFITTIIVLEADKREQVKSSLIDNKIYIEDSNPIFHRTKYLNQITREVLSPIIAVWDTDVILETKQILESAKLLRKKKADMVFPFDGLFFNTPPMFKEMYKKRRKMDIFSNNIGKFLPVYGHFSVGGAFNC